MCSSDDVVSEAELHALSGPELLDRTRDLVTAMNRLAADLARTVRVAEGRQAFAGDGMATAQSWLRGHCRLSRSAASQVVANGRAIATLPAVADAHAAGELTADQVTTIGKITGPRPTALAAARGVDLPAIAAMLTRFASTQPHEDLVKLVHAVLDRLDEDGPEPDPTEQRFLTFAKHADGSGTGRFHLDALGMEKLQAALESMLQANRPAADTRSRAQQQADALVQLCDLHLGCGTLPLLRRAKPQVAVKISSADLADPATGKGAAELGFGGIVSAAKARQVACDAELRRYLLSDDGELLDLGRSQRLATPALRKAVELRDETCVFAGCGAPNHWCEVHHVIPWLFGGETSLDNSGLLCERHHTRSTTASASNEIPPADGTPTAPTAPRSSPSDLPRTNPISPAPAEDVPPGGAPGRDGRGGRGRPRRVTRRAEVRRRLTVTGRRVRAASCSHPTERATRERLADVGLDPSVAAGRRRDRHHPAPQPPALTGYLATAARHRRHTGASLSSRAGPPRGRGSPPGCGWSGRAW